MAILAEQLECSQTGIILSIVTLFHILCLSFKEGGDVIIITDIDFNYHFCGYSHQY